MTPANVFTPYPRTFHLFGSNIASDDKMLSEKDTRVVLGNKNHSYVWESKLDGSNVALSVVDGVLKVQNRSHYLDERVHPQYYPLKSWAATFDDLLRDVLGDRYCMFGEWCYAVHTIRYTKLKHYFNEFDVWDRKNNIFLDTPTRHAMLKDLVDLGVLAQVPIVYNGPLTLEQARELMCHDPIYGEEKPEGLYLKVEANGQVVGRYKLVRDEFIQSIIDGQEHWEKKWARGDKSNIQGLAEGVDIFNI